MITKSTMISLRAQIDAAMIAIGKQNGVVISLGSGSFNSDSATFKMNVAAADKVNPNSGVSNAVIVREVKAAKDLVSRGFEVGLTKEMLGKTFTSRGVSYVVKGYMPSRHKYNVLVWNVSESKEMLFPAAFVLANIK